MRTLQLLSCGVLSCTAWYFRSNKDLTKAQKVRNNPARYYGYTKFGGHPMLAIAAAGAFIGLFALWVVLPKKLMRK